MKGSDNDVRVLQVTLLLSLTFFFLRCGEQYAAFRKTRLFPSGADALLLLRLTTEAVAKHSSTGLVQFQACELCERRKHHACDNKVHLLTPSVKRGRFDSLTSLPIPERSSKRHLGKNVKEPV
jgi:hypothetical protein